MKLKVIEEQGSAAVGVSAEGALYGTSGVSEEEEVRSWKPIESYSIRTHADGSVELELSFA